MFVSGPTGTSVMGCSEPWSRSAMKSTACWGTGSRPGGGELGAVEAGLSVDVGGDEAAPGRAAGRHRLRPARRPRDRRTPGREWAFAVVFSSVWLPETVVTPRSSISGLASARSRAIASSWPGSQSRMTGVLMRRVRMASTSSAVGSDGCAPRRDAAIAPAAHARSRASCAGRSSRSESGELGAERVASGRSVDRLARTEAPRVRSPRRPRGERRLRRPA